MYKIKLRCITLAGIAVNMVYGSSPEETEELLDTEYLFVDITQSGLVGLYHAPCANCDVLFPALNGVSAGGYLRRDDPRSVTLRKIVDGAC